MLRRTLLATASIVALSLSGIGQVAWAGASEADVKTSLAEFERASPAIKSIIEKAHGYAVFPTVGKGAIGIGGAHGDGLVYEKGKQALDKFKGGNFEFDAQVSAVAVTAGISRDAAYEHGVAIYTMAKGGFMYEASVGGQKFSFEPR